MDWLPYIPLDKDVQVSKSTDFEACGSYSFIHCLEMKLKQQTGLYFNFSERYMAKVSDTQTWGNTLQNILDGANTDGVCLVSDWPDLTYSGKYEDIDWATYYAPIPQSVKNKAYKVKASIRRLNNQLEVIQALESAPVWTIIKMANTNHIVSQINLKQFYDSYEVRLKNFADGYPIMSQYSLTIKTINMPNSEFVHKAGSNEYGFYLPALSVDELKGKALNFGLPITDALGNVDFTKAKEVTGL